MLRHEGVVGEPLDEEGEGHHVEYNQVENTLKIHELSSCSSASLGARKCNFPPVKVVTTHNYRS